MDEKPNPYASPEADLDKGPADLTDAESVRRAYLRHESSIRSIGALCYFVAILSGIIALAWLAGSTQATIYRQASIFWSAFFAAIALLFALLGRDLQRLEPKARIRAAAVAIFGLVLFPVGTAISIYVLYLMLSEKGRFVFSHEYSRVVRETSELECRTSPVVVLILVALSFLLFLAFLLAGFG